ncbi:MAG TPA: PEP-CTERM sorting domain-containing protein [Vicinamibacterales bacterium]|jgi:hypothetical protein|nr:PEP-CTERM sorting domain-containing protein [Vicinamibacterales bacterium]
MRIPALLVCFILFPASRLLAGPVFSMEFLNSNFTFGTVSPNQQGYDLTSFDIDAQVPDVDFIGVGYEAVGAAFDHQTLDQNAGGGVVSSHYFYTGGTFEILFAIDQNGVLRTGSFVAPIKTIEVTAGQWDGASAQASYELGPGIFDPSIAELLGIGRHTRSGTAVSQLLLTDDGNRGGVAGNHTTPERQAWDGVNDIELEVPEPAILALLATGMAGFSIRRRVRR